MGHWLLTTVGTTLLTPKDFRLVSTFSSKLDASDASLSLYVSTRLAVNKTVQFCKYDQHNFAIFQSRQANETCHKFGDVHNTELLSSVTVYDHSLHFIGGSSFGDIAYFEVGYFEDETAVYIAGCNRDSRSGNDSEDEYKGHCNVDSLGARVVVVAHLALIGRSDVSVDASSIFNPLTEITSKRDNSRTLISLLRQRIAAVTSQSRYESHARTKVVLVSYHGEFIDFELEASRLAQKVYFGSSYNSRQDLTLEISQSDTHVLLFVASDDFAQAQRLVFFWKRSCEIKTCQIYVHYHISIIESHIASSHVASHFFIINTALDYVEKIMTVRDIVVVLTGLDFARKFRQPGQISSGDIGLIPAVEYGKNDYYRLAAELVVSAGAGAGAGASKLCWDFRAFAGVAGVVRSLLYYARVAAAAASAKDQFSHGNLVDAVTGTIDICLCENDKNNLLGRSLLQYFNVSSPPILGESKLPDCTDNFFSIDKYTGKAIKVALDSGFRVFAPPVESHHYDQYIEEEQANLTHSSSHELHDSSSVAYSVVVDAFFGGESSFLALQDMDLMMAERMNTREWFNLASLSVALYKRLRDDRDPIPREFIWLPIAKLYEISRYSSKVNHEISRSEFIKTAAYLESAVHEFRAGQNFTQSPSQVQPSPQLTVCLEEDTEECSRMFSWRMRMDSCMISAMYAALSAVYAEIGPVERMLDAFEFSIQDHPYEYTLKNHENKKYCEEATSSYDDDIDKNKSTNTRPRMHVLTVASERTEGLSNLLLSARIAGIEIHVLGLDSHYNDYADKIRLYFEYVRDNLHDLDMMTSASCALHTGERRKSKSSLSFTEDDGSIQNGDIIVLVDAYDVLLTPAARRIPELLLGIEQEYYQSRQSSLPSQDKPPILFCGEYGKFPEGPGAFFYPIPDHLEGRNFVSPRYLNSGCIAGRAKEVLKLLKTAYDLRRQVRDDQQIYARLYLAGAVAMSRPSWVMSKTNQEHSHPPSIIIDTAQKVFVTGYRAFNGYYAGLDSYHIYSNASTVSPSTVDEMLHQFTLTPLFNLSIILSRNKVIPSIPILHCNNAKSNRLYDSVVLSIRRVYGEYYDTGDTDEDDFMLRAMHKAWDNQ